MKIFHKEEGKEVVYVQRQDMMHVEDKIDIAIPEPIMLNIFNGPQIVDESNRFDFVKFDEEHVVRFFRELDFIIDYEEFKDLTLEQINEKWQELAKKYNENVYKWNSMSIEERKENRSIFVENSDIDYMLNMIAEIYAVKSGEKNMQFPEFVEETKN